EAHAVRVGDEARAHGEPPALVEDPLQPGEGERGPAGHIRTSAPASSRAMSAPIADCPQPNVSGITHHASAFVPGAKSSAEPAAAKKTATTAAPRGSIPRAASRPSP